MVKVLDFLGVLAIVWLANWGAMWLGMCWVRKGYWTWR